MQPIHRYRERFWTTSLPFVLAAVLWQGCGGGVPPDKDVLRYSFWGGYLELQIWRELKETFEEKYPDVHVKLEYAPGSNNPGVVISRMVAGSAADVMMIDDDGLCFLASKGYLEDLDERIQRDGEELRIDEFMPTSLESAEYEGVHWAMPWDGFCGLIFANLDLFADAGIAPPTKEWTWNDFVRIAEKLTIDLNGDERPDQYGAVLHISTHDSLSILHSHGGSWMDPEKTRITFESGPATAVLEIYADLYFRTKAMPIPGLFGTMDKDVMILTGRVAMTLAPAYVMLNMKSIEGKRWDVFHMPSGPAGKAARVSWDCIGIYSEISERKKEIAWNWIKHILTPESQRVIGRSGRAMPVRPDDVLASFVDPKSPQHEERFLEAMMEYGVVTPQMLATKAWRREAESILNAYGSQVTNEWGKALMRGEELTEQDYRGDPNYFWTPEKTVNQIQVRCQAVIDDFNERGY